jgi:hypothetical protein
MVPKPLSGRLPLQKPKPFFKPSLKNHTITSRWLLFSLTTHGQRSFKHLVPIASSNMHQAASNNINGIKQQQHQQQHQPSAFKPQRVADFQKSEYNHRLSKAVELQDPKS